MASRRGNDPLTFCEHSTSDLLHRGAIVGEDGGVTSRYKYRKRPRLSGDGRWSLSDVRAEVVDRMRSGESHQHVVVSAAGKNHNRAENAAQRCGSGGEKLSLRPRV